MVVHGLAYVPIALYHSQKEKASDIAPSLTNGNQKYLVQRAERRRVPNGKRQLGETKRRIFQRERRQTHSIVQPAQRFRQRAAAGAVKGGFQKREEIAVGNAVLRVVFRRV